MISRRYPELMQDVATQEKIIKFIEAFIASHPRYHILKGRWYFSKTSNDWNFGNHLYLELREQPLIVMDHRLYSDTMCAFIMDICKEKVASDPDILSHDRLSRTVECNVVYAPYFVRVLPGPFVDALIECSMPLELQKLAFLQGSHARLGQQSTIQKYVSSSLFDKNTIKLVFGFLEPAKKPKIQSVPENDDHPSQGEKINAVSLK